MAAIDFSKELELLSLPLVAHILRIAKILDWRLAALQGRALIHSRHESSAPILRTVHDMPWIVFHDDERRQAVVLGSQPVVDPRAERRPAGEDRAGVHLTDAARMIQTVAIE